MQLTIKEFFDKFYILRQSCFSDQLGIKKERFSCIKNQGYSMTKEEIKQFNEYVQQLAVELKKVEIIHGNFSVEGQRRFTLRL